MAEKHKECATKTRIIKAARELFFGEGYTKTTARKISDTVGISTGNLTFHFPTKEHLLLELVKEFCSYQLDEVIRSIKHGDCRLRTYAAEIVMQTMICEKSESLRDFCVSAFTTPMTLAEIRSWDSKKSQLLFRSYNPDWAEQDFILAENAASGLEMGALMTECDEVVTLEDKLRTTLDSLMRLYNVPEPERLAVIDEVLKTDYDGLSQQLLDRLKEHKPDMHDFETDLQEVLRRDVL